MHPLLPWIWAAGILLLLIDLSGLIMPALLRFRENAARLDPTVREVFNIHNAYVGLFVLAFAVACFAYPAELVSGRGMGRFFSAFLATIWWIRLIIQFVYHNKEIKRQYPTMNVVFTLTFLYLGAVFTVAATGWGAR